MPIYGIMDVCKKIQTGSIATETQSQLKSGRREGSVSADPSRYSVHSIASGLGPVCVAKGPNPRKHRGPVQKGADDQEIIPARPRPVEEVYEQPTIYTNPRDPDSIINTKPLDTVSHREKDF